MKKIGISVLAGTAALALMFTMTSCNSDNVENAGEKLSILSLDDLKKNSSPDKPIVVSFWHSFGHNIEEALNPLIDSFEKEMEKKEIYIDIKATSTGGGYDGLRGQVNLGTKSNAIPTMLLGYPDHFADYIESGILLPLDEYVNAEDEEIGIANTSDFVDSYWAECKMTMKAENDDVAKEHIIAVPFNKSTEIMYYNASAVDPILSEKGYLDADGKWSQPTWDQLFEVAKTLKEKFESPEGITWKYNNISQTAKADKSKKSYPVYIDSGANFFITTARQWSDGSKDVYTRRNADGSGTVVFDNATVRSAQGTFLEKANQGLWNIPDKVNQGYGSALMLLNEAFISIGSTAGVNNNDSQKYQLKCTAIPQRSYDNNAVKAVIQQGTNAAILSKNSNNITRLAAWLLIRYLTNTENTTNFSMNTGYLPVRKTARDSEVFKTFLSNEEDLFDGNAAKAINAAYSQLDYFYTDPAFKGSSIVRDKVDSMIRTIYCNDHTIDDAIEACYRELQTQRIAVESEN